MTSNFGIRPDYKARAQPDYFVDNLTGAVWQPDVYRYAFQISEQLPSLLFFDFGCGNGDKLKSCPASHVIGYDVGVNLDIARDALPSIECRERDLELGAWLDLPYSVVVSADVIEHLKDPTRFLNSLAHYTKHMAAVIISTPDRLRLYGHDHNGEPTNPHHAREWTLDELTGYLQSLGANIRLTGYTRCNDISNVKSTMLIAGGVAEIDFEAIAKQVGIEVANVSEANR